MAFGCHLTNLFSITTLSLDGHSLFRGFLFSFLLKSITGFASVCLGSSVVLTALLPWFVMDKTVKTSPCTQGQLGNLNSFTELIMLKSSNAAHNICSKKQNKVLICP